MKKKVNGKVIDINIGIFEKAFEGLALGNSSASSISDKTSENSEIVNNYIEEYENIYKCIPFPLYAIESELKYAVIGNIIKKRQKIKNNNIWADKSLNIKVDDKTVLRFVGTTWSMLSFDKSKTQRSIDIKSYENEIGYNEYKWVMQRLLENKDLKEYYHKFMGSFIEACNNEPMVLKWELSKMLNFGYVPNQMEFKSNTVLDSSNNTEYMIDVFSTGRKKTGESEFVINLCGGDLVSEKPKYRQTYNYEVLEKSTGSSDDNKEMSRLKKSNKEGFAGMFETLVGTGAIRGEIGTMPYIGVVVANRIIYKVENKLYLCGFENYIRPVEIGNNVDIHSVENNLVYIVKNSKCERGVIKEYVYALSPADMQIKLCRIQYS